MKVLKYVCFDEERKIGLVAESLENLISKVRAKHKIPASQPLFVVLDIDGTLIDDEDYFSHIPDNTVLHLVHDPQHWLPARRRPISEAIKVLVDSAQHNSSVRLLRETLTKSSNTLEKLLLSLVIDTLETSHLAAKASRDEDPAWFEGLSANFKTKEAVLRESAKRRLRGYLRTATDYFQSASGDKKSQKVAELIADILVKFTDRLKAADYCGQWFDRSSAAVAGSDCLCDVDGWFECQGVFDKPQCISSHRINPYGSFDNRISFSTWNLDHGIEKSREVLPALREALQSVPNGKQVNWAYFYELLFTQQNLKLVHIACHDKSSHSTRKCDAKRFYVKC